MIPLKLKAVEIPNNPVIKNSTRQIYLLASCPKPFNNQEVGASELLIFTPRLATTP